MSGKPSWVCDGAVTLCAAGLFGCALLACGSFQPVAGQPPAAPARQPEAAKRPAWRYAVYYHDDLMAWGGRTLNENLTKLGDQGWELVTITQGLKGDGKAVLTTQTVYFFKRPK